MTGDVTDAQWSVLLGDYDLLECTNKVKPTPFDVLVHVTQMTQFADLGLTVELLPNNQFALQPPSAYYNSTEAEAQIDAIVNDARNTGIAVKVNLSALPGGQVTHDGNNIYALKLSDNAAIDEDEPGMVVQAQHHARESATSLITVGHMNRVFDRYYGNPSPTWGSGPVAIDPAIVSIVNSYELYFVPMVNPDGTDHTFCCNTNWRLNRRNNGGNFGVDLNRNYPFLWGVCGASTTPGSSTYRGPSSGSEPETQTMIALYRHVRPVSSIDYHSYGREVLHLYPPCATISAAVSAMADFYIDDLRFAISPSYATRFPSASGESCHDHWGNGGAMSLLVETLACCNFQPNFNTAVNEEARVWPGVEKVMKTWRPAIDGHIRSIVNNAPLEGFITYTPNQFSHNETSRSRPRDGRYNAFLPIGTWNVTWEVPGYQAVTKVVTVNSFNSTQTIDVDMTPNSVNTPTLTLGGSQQLGGTSTLTYDTSGDVGDIYWVTLAGSTTPGLDLGGCRVMPIAGDNLFFAMAFPNVLLSNHIGIIPAGESVTANLAVPNIPALANLTLQSIGLTMGTNYNTFVKIWSNVVPVTFQP